MSKINDEEDLIKRIKEFVKANLNTNIDLINAEKSDKYSIETIPADDDHYVLGGELLDWPNHTFVNFAIDGDIPVKTNIDDKISIPIVMVEVCFDNPKKAGTYFKSLRYMRALYQTLLNFGASAIEADGVEITKAVPMVVTALQRQLVVSGVSLNIAFG